MADERVLRARAALTDVIDALGQSEPLAADQAEALLNDAIDAQAGLDGLVAEEEQQEQPQPGE